MGVEKLLSEIDRIGQIAGRWSAGAEISDIEREIVLDKLKHIYEEVMFLDREQAEDTAADYPAGEADMPETVAEPETPADDTPDDPRPENPAADLSPEMSASTLMEETEISVTVEQQDVEQKLFCDEPMVRSRVDKKVILSLYGESGASHHVSHTTQTQYRGAAPQPVQAPSALPAEAAAKPTATVAGQSDTSAYVPVAGLGAEGIPHKKVLGETLGTSGAAINEVIGKKTGHADVASRLRASRISDLRHSIGINDRFLLMRDLFGGQAPEFDRVIGELDAFTALDDAMIYIQENFEWDPNGEATSLLVELLERKLEQ